MTLPMAALSLVGETMAQAAVFSKAKVLRPCKAMAVAVGVAAATEGGCFTTVGSKGPWGIRLQALSAKLKARPRPA
jgi:hypothetical protein